MTDYRMKRVYEDPGENDGWRVLVDRVWPRGMSKERAHLDQWAKDLAPSTDLRHWFDHRAERFEEFERRYREELDASAAAQQLADGLGVHDLVTLLYGAHDQTHNQAVVLAAWLSERRSGPRS